MYIRIAISIERLRVSRFLRSLANNLKYIYNIYLYIYIKYILNIYIQLYINIYNYTTITNNAAQIRTVPREMC